MSTRHLFATDLQLAGALRVPDEIRVAIRDGNEQPANGMSDDPETTHDRNRVKLDRLELALRASNEGIWDWRT